tara:strand:+ start:556 stop:729 length:174 start_codon:yes stop_codon:yes gene_type:complete
MTEYKKIELHRILKMNGDIEINIVPHNGAEPTEKTFTNYDEALSEIIGLEYENDIYF